jgi:hypothetical protein
MLSEVVEPKQKVHLVILEHRDGDGEDYKCEQKCHFRQKLEQARPWQTRGARPSTLCQKSALNANNRISNALAPERKRERGSIDGAY